jgi:hypothetical protein
MPLCKQLLHLCVIIIIDFNLEDYISIDKTITLSTIRLNVNGSNCMKFMFVNDTYLISKFFKYNLTQKI